jgi:thioester reductase-like protein
MTHSYRASWEQQEIWFAQERYPASVGFNIVRAWDLRGQLDTARLAAAIHAVMAAHDSLRTTYRNTRRGIEAVVGEHGELAAESCIPIDRELTDGPYSAEAVIREERARVWNLETGPVAAWRLVRLSDHHHVLIFSAHHIAVDGVSLKTVWRHLALAYDGEPYDGGTPVTGATYEDFATAQPGLARDGDRLYWRKALSQISLAPALHPGEKLTRTAPCHTAFDMTGMIQQLNTMSRSLRLSPTAILATGISAIMADGTGQDVIVLGMPFSRRTSYRYRSTVGNFVTMLPVTLPAAAGSAAEAARASQAAIWDAVEHANVSYMDLLRDWRQHRQDPRGELITACLDVHPDAGNLRLGALCCTDVTPPATSIRFPVEWHFNRTCDGHFQGQILQVRTAQAADSDALAEALVHLLAQWTANPGAAVKAVSLKQAPAPCRDLDRPISAGQPGPADRPDTELTILIKDLMRSVLDCESFGAGDNFFEHGGNSAAAALLVADLRDLAGIEVPLGVIFDKPTAADLARALSGGDTMHSGSSLEVPRLPAPVKVRRRAKAAGGPIITGATGIVGRYVLERLLRARTGKVIVLGRGADETELRARVSSALKVSGLWRPGDDQRIDARLADLGRRGCGLSQSDLERLAADANMVIHCAADTSPFRNCHQLYAVNVDSTTELLKIAVEQGIPFHLVSTISVAPTQGDRMFAQRRLGRSGSVLESEDIARAPGYVQTKWLAESVVEQAFEAGLPGSISRLARITGDSRTGWYGIDDAFSRLVSAVIRLEAVSDLPQADLWTPVDVAATHLAAALETDTSSVRAVPFARIPLARLWDALREEGLRLQLVPHEEWLAALSADPQNIAAAQAARRWASPGRNHIVGRGLREGGDADLYDIDDKIFALYARALIGKIFDASTP